MRLAELAQRLQCERHGESAMEITGIASLGQAGAGDLSFLLDPRFSDEAKASRAGAVLTTEALRAKVDASSRSWLICDDPALAMVRAVELLRPVWRPEPGIHPTAWIDPTAELGEGCHVGAFVVVGARSRIGAGAVLHPHVVIYPDVAAGRRLLAHAHVVIREGTRLGDDVVLQPGVVLGGDGFAFARGPAGTHVKIPQVGVVEIGNEVEIQANSCVDRASLDATCIRAGAKLDNLVQVAHNCDVGAGALVCAQVGLAGSVQVGAGAILAGQAGVADHSVVGAGAVVTAQSGTHGVLRDGGMYSGSPAMEHAVWLRACALMPRLPDMQREMRRLAQAVARLERECES